MLVLDIPYAIHWQLMPFLNRKADMATAHYENMRPWTISHNCSVRIVVAFIVQPVGDGPFPDL